MYSNVGQKPGGFEPYSTQSKSRETAAQKNNPRPSTSSANHPQDARVRTSFSVPPTNYGLPLQQTFYQPHFQTLPFLINPNLTITRVPVNQTAAKPTIHVMNPPRYPTQQMTMQNLTYSHVKCPPVLKGQIGIGNLGIQPIPPGQQVQTKFGGNFAPGDRIRRGNLGKHLRPSREDVQIQGSVQPKLGQKIGRVGGSSGSGQIAAPGVQEQQLQGAKEVQDDEHTVEHGQTQVSNTEIQVSNPFRRANKYKTSVHGRNL